MKKKLQKIVVCVLMGFSWYLQVHANENSHSEFIITPTKKKKRSSDELKEEIGCKIQELLEQSTALTLQMGRMQCLVASTASTSSLLHDALGQILQGVSNVQKKCFNAVKKLIDSQKPFKKASKSTLEKTVTALVSVQNGYESATDLLKKLNNTIKKNSDPTSLDKAAESLKKQQKRLQANEISFNQDECLKNI